MRCLPTVLLSFSCLLTAFSCTETVEKPARNGNAPDPLFTLLPPEQSGVTFVNQLTEGPNTNILMYEYFYNGGGVAAADFDGDGNTDLYFTANMTENRLYLNRGNFTFEDVTAPSGTAGRPGPWKTGVAVVDINADGLPDLYVSYSGMLPPEKRRNQLFVNLGPGENGIPVFRESAADYGLDLPSFTNQAYFLDYDGDGDLDALMLNHNPKSLPILNVEKTRQLSETPDPERGLRLYRNEAGKYTDVTEAAGINGSPLSYGLGLALTDLNEDGLTDFYVSNDYEVPDYLYLNNGDGTFTNELPERIGHTSHFSMGSDIADVNNDGKPDIYTLDMLPADNRRRKLLMADDNRSRHDLNRASGYPDQTMRNMLQLNRGDGTFAEIGQLAGVDATDWSWSALLVDLDNDGFKDLHVTNGYVRDYTNLDFIKYMDDFVAQRGRLQRTDVLELLKEMPASDVSNFVFKNQGGLQFGDRTEEWGLQRASNSNGAVAVDLDNDGDLDLVVNNLNQPAFIYRNNGTAHHYLQVDLRGPADNPSGIGAVVTLDLDTSLLQQAYYPNRGYLSSGPERLHFGLGALTQVPGLTVKWPGNRVQTLSDVPTDQVITLDIGDATAPEAQTVAENDGSTPLFKKVTPPFAYRDEPSTFYDFDRQPLLRRQLSDSGPVVVKGDLNGDGREDLILGGGAREGFTVAIAGPQGSFRTTSTAIPGANGNYRITALALVDANGDEHPDLYVGRGGYHDLEADSPELGDLLFLNDGTGSFTASSTTLPTTGPTATTAATSWQGSATMIFVGGGTLPGRYPESSDSYLLRLDASNGKFARVDAPDLTALGAVTDAVWHDLNGDDLPELIVVGEWMPIRVFSLSEGGDVSDVTVDYFADSPSGWWNTIAVADLDADGRPDLVVGNEGGNHGYGVGPDSPAKLVAADQDGNGSLDPFFSYWIDGTRYPDMTRDELIGQLARQRARFPNYEAYASVTAAELEAALPVSPTLNLEADRLTTSLFLQSEDGTYSDHPLPPEAQFAPVHVIHIADFDGDGSPDLLLAGNELQARLRYGNSDANAGTVLLNDGAAGFTALPPAVSGLQLQGAVRFAVQLDRQLLLGITGADVEVYGMADRPNSR